MFKKLFGKFKKVETPPVESLAPESNWLPTLDPEEMAVRTKEELYQRLIALWAVVVKAKFPDNEFPMEYLTESGQLDWLSPAERAYLLNDNPTENDDVAFSWRAEALSMLCWCGGILSGIQLEGENTDPSEFIELFPFDFDDGDRLREAIQIRNKAELIAWSDRLYHAHSKIRSASRGGPKVPSTWSLDKIMEWHYAINWMIYFSDEPQEWDDVTTDT